MIAPMDAAALVAAAAAASISPIAWRAASAAQVPPAISSAHPRLMAGVALGS